MGEVQWVDDPSDPRVRDYVGLSDVDLRRRIEAPAGAGHGIFIVEGMLAVERLFRSRYPVRSVLVLPGRLPVMVAAFGRVGAALDHVPILVASREIMAGVAGFDVHRGSLAAATRLAPATVEATIAGAQRLVVLEGITDQENLGALFRNAAAFGVDGVVLGPGCGDPLYRRSVRVSVGHVLGLDFATAEAWPETLHQLKAAGLVLVALTPDPHVPAMRTLGLGRRRVALMLGSEGPGLSQTALASADCRARVPHREQVDSLNVATAAAIALYEIDRL